jgi:hypothetical protein
MLKHVKLLVYNLFIILLTLSSVKCYSQTLKHDRNIEVLKNKIQGKWVYKNTDGVVIVYIINDTNLLNDNTKYTYKIILDSINENGKHYSNLVDPLICYYRNNELQYSDAIISVTKKQLVLMNMDMPSQIIQFRKKCTSANKGLPKCGHKYKSQH